MFPLESKLRFDLLGLNDGLWLDIGLLLDVGF